MFTRNLKPQLGLFETEKLLNEWRQERATKVVFAMSRIGLALAVATTAVDLLFEMPWLVILGDAIMMIGFIMSFSFSRTKNKKADRAWPFLYFGLWAACTTSLGTTGGINSPFIGSYWALLYVGGLLIQTSFRSIFVTGFVLLNLGVWLFLEEFFPGHFGEAPPMTFSFLVNFIVLGGLMLFIAEFLKTERGLGRELLRRYQELHRTRENLLRQEEANAAKSTFLANISHELRTPLGAILGYADLMQAPDIPREDKEYFASTIHRNGVHLSRLVDDLLDLSKAEAGKIEIERTRIQLRESLEEVIDFFSVPARNKGLRLHLDFRDPLPTSIVTDPLRFNQILQNLIGNALKFTSQGQICVRVSAQPQRHPGLRIEFEDTGIGLTADEEKKLFNAFTQADASVTRQFGGTGLGLSLSKKLARLLGGDLLLEWSEKGKGSRFVLQLPLAAMEVSPSLLNEI